MLPGSLRRAEREFGLRRDVLSRDLRSLIVQATPGEVEMVERLASGALDGGALIPFAGRVDGIRCRDQVIPGHVEMPGVGLHHCPSAIGVPHLAGRYTL